MRFGFNASQAATNPQSRNIGTFAHHADGNNPGLGIISEYSDGAVNVVLQIGRDTHADPSDAQAVRQLYGHDPQVLPTIIGCRKSVLPSALSRAFPGSAELFLVHL